MDTLTFTDLQGRKYTIHASAVFNATDKLGASYNYMYVGMERTENHFDIHLHNMTWNDETYVEPAWFTQRTIKMIKEG